MRALERLKGSRMQATDRRRLLMISPYFPPRRRIGAQRAFKFVRYLPELGIEPFVICLATPGELCSEPERAVLADVGQLALRAPFDRRRLQGAARSAEAPSGGSARLRGWLDERLPASLSGWLDDHIPASANLRDWLDDRIPIDSWWPVLLGQLPHVLAAARAFAPHAVWSTADPWSSHALALRVARRLDLPWIADFRDPWTLCRVRGRGRPSWVRRIDARAERTYLEAAAAATFTAASTTERYRAAYPALATRFHTIENAYDPHSYLDPIEAPPGQAQGAPEPELVLAFFGRFRRLSSAGRVIELLSKLAELDPWAAARVRVRSVGALEAEDRALAVARGVAQAFEAMAPVPLERALASLRRADLLLLSSERGRSEIIPAKLFDYLAAGRPVLSLCENPEVEAILARCGAGAQFAGEDLRQAALLLAACVHAKSEGRALPLAASRDANEVAALSAPVQTARLAALVREVSAR